MDVTNTGNGDRVTRNRERGTGNRSLGTNIQNGGQNKRKAFRMDSPKYGETLKYMYIKYQPILVV